jgi:hypothetical protein
MHKVWNNYDNNKRNNNKSIQEKKKRQGKTLSIDIVFPSLYE